MGLRCSLLGHDYGDVAVEREREERGSEVVLTVREYEECTQCGDRHVVSENTEVRSISTDDVDPRPDASEPRSTPRSAEPPGADPDSGNTGAFAAETGETDATFIDADEDGAVDADPERRSEPTETEYEFPGANGADAPTTEAGIGPREATSEADPQGAADTRPEPSDRGNTADTGIELPTDENGDPVTDDGEILEDDGTPAREREYGEWPDSSDVGPPIETTPESDDEDWPDRESEPLEDDAILLDTGTTEPSSDRGEAEPAPETAAGGPPAADDPETANDAESVAEPGSGIERASEAPTPGSEGGIPGGDGQAQLHCPRCGFTAGSDRSSLRTGDICPDCRKGYLGVQPDR
ncbi:DUF7093 family protein [Natronococcus occultus]|uniref:Uncharacterized protein n=1 Tax=Natronococcus occultus SP4 TaxID=694430 RepID=L0K1B9_9EURY|nr:hypothetical protein [Natronococcus occultus]AGB38159.1 hypothetical protein Natoc_2383 [Natronococcus occultus SP4]